MMTDFDIVRRNDDPNVRRSDRPRAIDPFRNLKTLPQKDVSAISYDLTELLSDQILVNVLTKSNIFVFGKVGFLDLVLEALQLLYTKKGNQQLETARTQVDVTNLGAETPSLPFILIPAAKNREGISEIVASAFSIKRPIWLGALPSQIEKQILLSFDCFFIASGPKHEINYLCDLIGLKNEHRDTLSERGFSILTMDHDFPKIKKGQSDSPGRVFYIQNLK